MVSSLMDAIDVADRVETALHLFRRHEVLHLPVVERGALVGLLSKAELLRQRQRGGVTETSAVRDVMCTEVLDDRGGDSKLYRIRDIVRAVCKGPVVHAAASDRVGAVLNLFRRHEVTQLPVVDGTVLAGTVAKADVLRRLLRGSIRCSTPVRDVMRTAVSTVHVDASAPEVFRILERDELAVALDDERHVVGVITRSRLAEIFARGGAARSS